MLVNVDHMTDTTTGVQTMIRLRRAGREYAIVEAIRKLDSKGHYKMHTKGEICRVMGIKSTSRIRDILRDMANTGRLVSATTALDGYADEVEIFGIAQYEQTPLPDNHVIVINGVSCRMNGEVMNYA